MRHTVELDSIFSGHNQSDMKNRIGNNNRRLKGLQNNHWPHQKKKHSNIQSVFTNVQPYIVVIISYFLKSYFFILSFYLNKCIFSI